MPQLLAKLQHAAGLADGHSSGRVETLDAQALAEEFIGDAIVSNILVLGYGWQRGLVPVGLAALQRAISLNGVAVQSNLQAFALGRLAAADPAGLAALRQVADPVLAGSGPVDRSGSTALDLGMPKDGDPDDSLATLLARGVQDLTAYQNAAYAQQYTEVVQRVQQHEQALGADDRLPLTRAVARCLHKLMAVKDEYEVARLYSDGRFRQQLAVQFEGDFKLEFHLAPPLLSRAKGDQPPRDRKSTRLNSSHPRLSRMPSSA